MKIYQKFKEFCSGCFSCNLEDWEVHWGHHRGIEKEFCDGNKEVVNVNAESPLAGAPQPTTCA